MGMRIRLSTPTAEESMCEIRDEVIPIRFRNRLCHPIRTLKLLAAEGGVPISPKACCQCTVTFFGVVIVTNLLNFKALSRWYNAEMQRYSKMQGFVEMQCPHEV